MSHGSSELDIRAATQKLGHNLDRFPASVCTPLGQPKAMVVPGTEHVGVKVMLAAVLADTLDTGMELPAPLPAEVMEQARQGDCGERVGRLTGGALGVWDEWAQAVETELLAA